MTLAEPISTFPQKLYRPGTIPSKQSVGGYPVLKDKWV